LPFHQRVEQVHDRDVASPHLQPARGFETEQPATDDDRARLRSRAPEQGSRIVERAEREHAVFVEPCDRRKPRCAAGRQQQRVVRRDASVVAGDRFPCAHPRRPSARRREVDGVSLIPLEPVDDDVVRALFPGEHRREQHPVVVDVGLVAEDRDVEARREPEDLLEAGHAGHAVADHDQLLHRAVLSTRTADCL
jgi:hypothetical protein